jgi:hypothetical protein
MESQTSSSRGFERALPYISLALLCLFCHGILLTNDGLIWDGWYAFDWVKSHNWTQLHHFFDSIGIPLFGWLYRVFAFAPALISTFMWSTVICFFVAGAMTYKLGLKAGLTGGEALAIAALTEAMPLFTAAQEFIMFPFIFTHALLLVAVLLFTRAMTEQGAWHWGLRIVGVVLFFVSFTNAALLVYYGGVYIFLWYYYKRTRSLSFFPAVRSYLVRYPELFLLPPATWYARMTLFRPYGWYEHYNEPHLDQAPANVWSFFHNVPLYTARNCWSWITAHPVIVLIMVGLVVLYYFFAPVSWRVDRSSLPTRHLIWFGALLLFLAVFPFAAAGKYFWPAPGENSRHCILTPLPAALLVFSALRLIFTPRAKMSSRLIAPVTACLAIVLGVQDWRPYINERAEWIFSRSVLYHATRNELVRSSSVIYLPDYSVSREYVYGTYGFKLAFGGKLERLVTRRPPTNGEYYTVSEIENIFGATSMLPSEFVNVNRHGRQVAIEATRNRGDATDWDIVRRYLQLRYSGDRKALEAFLGSLSTLKVTTLHDPG